MEETHCVPGDSKTPKPRRGIVTLLLGRESVDSSVSCEDAIADVKYTSSLIIWILKRLKANVDVEVSLVLMRCIDIFYSQLLLP